jgi:alkylation response protein AidB-like acyl-CoA dehydrogenase
VNRLNAHEIKELALKLASAKLAPLAAELDRTHTFPIDNIKALKQAGFDGIIASADVGGIDSGRTGLVSFVREIAKACASTGLVYVSHLIASKAIEQNGSEFAKKNMLRDLIHGDLLGAFAVHEPDSGSNAGAVATSAKKEGDSYVINGSKFLITSAGEADVYLILARTGQNGAQGLSTFFIEKDTPGLSFGKNEDKMGLRGTSSKSMFFSDCKIPQTHLLGQEGDGVKVIGGSVVAWGFFGAAAISAGIAEAARDYAVKHASERTISGQPIGSHQAVQSMIADMVLKTEASGALLDACAERSDENPGTAAISGIKAKLFASEAAVAVADKAIQVMGGHGYCCDYNVERLYRDSRGMTLHFKTSEWLRQDIAKAALGF